MGVKKRINYDGDKYEGNEGMGAMGSSTLEAHAAVIDAAAVGVVHGCIRLPPREMFANA